MHPSLQAKPYEFVLHRNFLLTRLAVSLGALVSAPLCLAVRDAPSWWEASALAWLLLPAAGVASVSRTGSLVVGEALSLAAWIGLAVTLAVGGAPASGLGLLLIVPLQAGLTSIPVSKSASISTAIAIGAALVMSALIGVGIVPAAGLAVARFGAGIAAAALIYGIVIALMADRLRLRRDREAAFAHQRFRDLSDAIDDVPMTLDGSGQVIEAGASAQRLFQIDPRDLRGRGLVEHVHVGDRPAFLTMVADAAGGARGPSIVVRLRTGTTLRSDRGAFREPVFAWAEVRAVPKAEKANGPGTSRVLCLMRDVTERQEREAVIEEASRAVQRNDAGRALFLATMSHELRTPLNAIIGFADMLASEAMEPPSVVKQREYASIIRQSGHHLLSVVNSILDASKIESGSFSIVPASFDLAPLVEASCDMVSLEAAERGVELRRNLSPAMAAVMGDERAYRQILINLLSNALKFTPAGGCVTVAASPEGTSVILSVADTGVGIDAVDLPRLGAPFFRAQSSYDRAFDGTGLGLSVVRGLVGLHGGTVTIESAPGCGTRVSVRMPSDCASPGRACVNDTKIETIPRYGASSRHAAGPTAFARIHQSA